MNNVTCSIVEDLLPLYMDGCCSKDSQQAVAEHMKTCEKCRETYRHLQSDLPTIANETTDMRSEEIARSLSKRIKKRKAAAAVFAVIFFVFAMISIFFVGKAIMIMRGQGSQVSLGSLESAVNLSEGDFSCSAQDIGAYSFFTNTTRIIIRTDSPLDETVTVRLWNTENMSELDYNGMFEYLYGMKYGEKFNSEDYPNGIPKEEFESLIMEYLPITAEQIREYAVFDEENQTYLWARLGCFNYAPTFFGTSLPEVVDIKENQDGTVTLTVEAVCDMVICDDAVITHELTVKFAEDGSFQYLGNEILNDGIMHIPDYQYRIKE